jgi:hypothetical protein
MKASFHTQKGLSAEKGLYAEHSTAEHSTAEHSTAEHSTAPSEIVF